MAAIRFLLENWISHEPTGSLWLGVACALFFGVTFVRGRSGDTSAWGWLRNLLEAFTRAAVFAAMVGGVYFLLNSSYAAFSKIYGSFSTGGSLSEQARQPWTKVYGGLFFEQRDLQVIQYTTVETLEMIQPENSAVPLYRNVRVDQPVSENSITRFRGDVTFQDADRKHQNDTFNAFAISARYTYDVLNPTDSRTRAVFSFPLYWGVKLFQDVSVEINGRAVPWEVVDGAITWETQMEPGEKDTITVRYSTWGMEGFQYVVPVPREILDFKLVVASDTALG